MALSVESPHVVLSTSGLYGPGLAACWYLVLAALILSWVYEPDTRYRPGYKFAAAVAYPAFSIVHLFWQLCAFPRDKAPYLRANLLKIIVDGGGNPPVTAEYDPPRVSEPWDEPGPDMFQIFPLVVSINAALRVNDNCFYLCIIGMAILVFGPRREGVDPRVPSVLYILAAGVVLVMLNSFLLLATCGGIRGLLIPLEAFLFRVMATSLSACALLAFATVAMPFEMARKEVVKTYREVGSMRQLLNAVGRKVYRYLSNSVSGLSGWEICVGGLFGIACVVCWGLFVAGAISSLQIVFPTQLFFSDIGISILRQDQGAALVGGMAILLATLFRVATDQRWLPLNVDMDDS